MARKKIKIGVAACLMGQKVRYNAGDKFDPFVVETLGEYFELVPVCPEVEAGLGVPRESMQLKKVGSKIRLITHESKSDVTHSLESYSKKRIHLLMKEGLCGYIFKKNSPSCGMARVRVYSAKGIPFNNGTGVFAKELMERMPNLPVEEEGRLKDIHLKENWLERVMAYSDLRSLFDSNWQLKDLVNFHTKYKLVLMAHDNEAYKTLGREVANAKKKPKNSFSTEYEEKFMNALSKIATPKKHINVMQHMLGYLKGVLDAKTRQEILNLMEEYRKGVYPLVVPLVLLRHYIEKYEVSYLMGQVYLEPNPKDWLLRACPP